VIEAHQARPPGEPDPPRPPHHARSWTAWPRLIGWLGCAALTALAAYRSLREPFGAPVPTAANTAEPRGADFRDATYYPIKEFLTGGDPYDPAKMFAHWPVRQEFDLYGPFHLVLHAPLTLLPYRAALDVFSVLALACVFGTGLIAARTARLPGGWLAACYAGAVVALSELSKAALYFGQVDALLGLGGALVLGLAGRSGQAVRSDLAGRSGQGAGSRRWTVVGMALMWIKPQFGIPVALLLIARGRWRETALGTGAAVLLSLPVVVPLVIREGGIGGFVRVIRANLAYAGSIPATAVNAPDGSRVDLAAVTFRLTHLLPPGAEAIAAVLVLGVAGWLVGRPGRRGLPFGPAELLLAGLAVMISMVHQHAGSLITVPGIVAVVAAVLRRERVPVAVLLATALAFVPLLRVDAVRTILRAGLGEHTAGLVEGVSLITAFVLVAASLARTPPDRIRPGN